MKTFGALYTEIDFSIIGLAVQSGVSHAVISDMIANRPVPKWMAEKVLRGLSARTGQQYSLENILVRLVEDEG